MISEKALILSLFDAIGALAKRLTGETLEIALFDEEGSHRWHSPSSLYTRWCKPTEDIVTPVAAQSLCAETLEFPHKPDEFQTLSCTNEKKD